MQAIHEDLEQELGARWQPYLVGTGSLFPTGATLRFLLANANAEEYSNAQIDDYHGMPRRRFAWHPPLRLTVRARFSAPAEKLKGTAGFGFWNDPFLMSGARVPTLPRATWYFYSSPPSNMKLDLRTPGHGWKAATLDALRPAAVLWAPLAPLLVALMNLRPVYRILWPSIQQSLKVREAIIPVDMTQWHTYILDWGMEASHFSLSGLAPHSKPLLIAPSPRGPLGFVMWMDNQYLVATPWGQIRWGLLDAEESQWMEVDWFAIEPSQDGNHR
jgi:hypothetical protein